MIKEHKAIGVIGKVGFVFIILLVLDLQNLTATKTRNLPSRLAYQTQYTYGKRRISFSTRQKSVPVVVERSRRIWSNAKDTYFIDHESELEIHDTKPRTSFDFLVNSDESNSETNNVSQHQTLLDSSSKLYYFSNVKSVHELNGKTLLPTNESFDNVNVIQDRNHEAGPFDFSQLYTTSLTSVGSSPVVVTPIDTTLNGIRSVADDGKSASKLISKESTHENELVQSTLASAANMIIAPIQLPATSLHNEFKPNIINQVKNNGSVTFRSLWRQRQARSAEEGIRREKTSRLAGVLDKVRDEMIQLENRKVNSSRKFAARTITGFINALAEDVDGLDVQVKSNPKTPFWKKQVDDITIQFSRLGFKPLRISGGVLEPGQKTHHFQARSLLGIYDTFAASVDTSTGFASNLLNSTMQTINSAADRTLRSIYDDSRYQSPTADEAFDRIDVDNSGSLDRDELVQALNLAATANFEDLNEDNQHILENLANDLVELYDINGDGVVDRKEYKSMVADMAELRQEQIQSQYQIDSQIDKQQQLQEMIVENSVKPTDNKINQIRCWVGMIAGWFVSMFKRNGTQNGEVTEQKVKGNEKEVTDVAATTALQGKSTLSVVDSPELVSSVAKSLGSITFSDVKLDLRQLLFGAVPVLKHITPGGPLVLEPFTVTVNGSFNRDDIRDSFLLDAALRRLVSRVIRIRTGSVRDFIEGAVFNGRSWRMFGESGPKVEIPELTEIEFDNNKLVITGRARVRTSPTAPIVEQAFKVRTSIGTRQNGRFIRLEEPELALVLECPKSWERNIVLVCDALKIKRPSRPKPLYSFFPIYSPFKMNEDDGFDLGEDNTINSLYVQDGALCFEMSSVLRPGRFLGSHYLAFSIPSRTFIVTVDRVVEGIKAARKTKKAALALKQTSVDRRSMTRLRLRQMKDLEPRQQSGGASNTKIKPVSSRGFFGRFVDGYLQVEKDESKQEQITTAIRDYFGRQAAPTSAYFKVNPNFIYKD